MIATMVAITKTPAVTRVGVKTDHQDQLINFNAFNIISIPMIFTIVAIMPFNCNHEGTLSIKIQPIKQ